MTLLGRVETQATALKADVRNAIKVYKTITIKTNTNDKIRDYHHCPFPVKF